MLTAAVPTGLQLTWPVAAAVLVGAALHALWNALIKGGTDKPLDTALLLGLHDHRPSYRWRNKAHYHYP